MDKLDSVSFDKLLSESQPFRTSKPTFDLRDVQFFTPAGIAQLTAACYVLAAQGSRPRIRLSWDSSILSYLNRLEFFSIIGEVAQIEPEIVADLFSGSTGYHGQSDVLIELTMLSAAADLAPILDKTVDVLCTRLHYSQNKAFDAAIALSEVAQNIFDHGHNDDGSYGFVAMQVYGQGQNRFVEFCVADCGVGLAATLQRNPTHDRTLSDMEAIKVATASGTSEYDDPTRGTGLFHLLETVLQHEGMVQIRSGAAKVRYRMDKRRGWRIPVSKMPGVQIVVNLPAEEGIV